MKRVYVETYGCQMNVADTGLIRHVLEGAGYRFTEDVQEATLVLLNTCAVREKAEERVAARLRQLGRLKSIRPDLVLGVTGCMPKHLGDALRQRLPQVDLLIGPDSYRRLPELVEAAAERPTVDLRLDLDEDYADLDPVGLEGVNAFVPIMRGCDRFCTFCVVPLTRGREKSLPLDEVLRHARSAIERGARQVTLLGQTVNSYRSGEAGFNDLLAAVASLPGLLRVRFTSPHPCHFDAETFRLMAERPILSPQVHLPAQSGSDSVLERMKRGYTRERFLEIVRMIRARLPEVGLSTDVIVGFPGETDDDFEATLSLMREVEFDSAFLFRYSERSGTYASRHQADDVPLEVKAERLQRLIELQETISARRYAASVGREVEVLVEGPSRRNPLHAVGKAPDGKTVIVPNDGVAGVLRRVLIADASSHTLRAQGVAEVELEGEEPAIVELET